jgi:hypothetical protein
MDFLLTLLGQESCAQKSEQRLKFRKFRGVAIDLISAKQLAR